MMFILINKKQTVFLQSALTPVIHLRVTRTHSLFLDPSPLFFPADKLVYAEFGLYFLIHRRFSVAYASFWFSPCQIGGFHDVDLHYLCAERYGEQCFAEKILICVDRDRTDFFALGYITGFFVKNYSAVHGLLLRDWFKIEPLPVFPKAYPARPGDYKITVTPSVAWYQFSLFKLDENSFLVRNIKVRRREIKINLGWNTCQIIQLVYESFDKALFIILIFHIHFPVKQRARDP